MRCTKLSRVMAGVESVPTAPLAASIPPPCSGGSSKNALRGIGRKQDQVTV